MADEQDTVEIVRRRLADGRTISDGDVHRLIEEIDRLRAAAAPVSRGGQPSPG